MSRTSTLMAVISTDPTSTSDLYDRVGYVTLARLGLIPYHAFRAELAALATTGAIESATAPDGSTVWRRAPENGPPAEPIIE
ncbi:MAG TPA: hypothetical protein VJ741_16925 [Solirubrobacteraceae bacterium]|nr:hypothetical protein [Solirubrobacteraceae bacterium]